jgi:hypothetical protein
MTDTDTIEPPEAKPPARVSCAVCRRELAADQALNQEGEDYVLWFCGIACYEKWRSAQTEHDQK